MRLILLAAVLLPCIFQMPAALAQDYRISGRVVNADTGAALPSTQVAISAERDDDRDTPRTNRRTRPPSPPTGYLRSDTQSVLTGPDGSFRFEHVPAGKYSLSGTRRGFITGHYQEHGLYSTAIVTGEGLPSDDLTLKLFPGAVISGLVTDNLGDPVEQANVSLYRLQDDGLGNIRAFRAMQTNDLGAYEFAHLQPGTYFLSVTGRPWYAVIAQPEEQDSSTRPASQGNLDVVYPRTYYADATDSASATPIPLRGGDQVRVNLHMNAVPAVHLTIQMQSPGDDRSTSPARGYRSGGFHVPVLQERVFGEMESSGSAGGRIAFQGGGDNQTITMSVAPGEYQLEDGGYILPVSATGDSQLDPRNGIASTPVTGRVGAVGGGTLPPSVTLTLSPANGRTSDSISTDQHDGTYTFQSVPPGDYELEAQADSEKLAIVQIAATGAALDGHVLKIGSPPVTFAATLGPAASIVSGFAEDTGRPASGAMIVLVPQHPSDHSLYRRDQSDSDGSFTLHDVAPGRYTLVAIRDGWDLDWARPEVITHYLPSGQQVTVNGTSNIIHPITPVVVQPR